MGQWISFQTLSFISLTTSSWSRISLRTATWCVSSTTSLWRRSSSSHRLIDFCFFLFFFFRDLVDANEVVTFLSHNFVSHRSVRILVCARLIKSTKREMIRPKSWSVERSAECTKWEFHINWNLMRRRVQTSVGAQTGRTSFIDVVEEGLVDVFLIASYQISLFHDRSQGERLVQKMCNSPWHDKFLRDSHEMQSWRRTDTNLQSYSHYSIATGWMSIWKTTGSAWRVVGFPVWFKAHCTTRQHSWSNLACLVWTMSHRIHLLRFCTAPFCRSSATWCSDEFTLGQSKLVLPVSVVVLQSGADHVSWVSASGLYVGLYRRRWCVLRWGIIRTLQHVVLPLGSSVLPQHRRIADVEHESQQ